MTFIYKIKHKIYPEHLLQSTQCIMDVHSYQTRSREDFYVATVSNRYGQNDIFHNGLVQYNSLPQDLKKARFE